jgi:NADH-quinone oxidoreductase subunit C
MPATPKTTQSPAETGAGERANCKASEKVSPGDSSATIAGQGQGSPAIITTAIDEPTAPEPTSDRPERGPSGAATAGKFPDRLPEKPGS